MGVSCGGDDVLSAKIFWIAGPWPGRLGIVPRPRGADWLDDDTRAWRDAGIDVVVSLLEPAEEAELDLSRESTSSTASGLEFRSFPISDLGVPKSREAVAELMGDLVAALRASKSVVLHCRQSIGRSGLVAATVLVSGGHSAHAAIDAVRQARGVDVPETHAQRQWIADFAAWLARA